MAVINSDWFHGIKNWWDVNSLKNHSLQKEGTMAKDPTPNTVTLGEAIDEATKDLAPQKGFLTEPDWFLKTPKGKFIHAEGENRLNEIKNAGWREIGRSWYKCEKRLDGCKNSVTWIRDDDDNGEWMRDGDYGRGTAFACDNCVLMKTKQEVDINYTVPMDLSEYNDAKAFTKEPSLDYLKDDTLWTIEPSTEWVGICSPINPRIGITFK